MLCLHRALVRRGGPREFTRVSRRSFLFAGVRPDAHRPAGLVPVRHQPLAVPLPLRPILPDRVPVVRDGVALLETRGDIALA